MLKIGKFSSLLAVQEWKWKKRGPSARLMCYKNRRQRHNVYGTHFFRTVNILVHMLFSLHTIRGTGHVSCSVKCADAGLTYSRRAPMSVLVVCGLVLDAITLRTLSLPCEEEQLPSSFEQSGGYCRPLAFERKSTTSKATYIQRLQVHARDASPFASRNGP
jgi:hypothetical protein